LCFGFYAGGGRFSGIGRRFRKKKGLEQRVLRRDAKKMAGRIWRSGKGAYLCTPQTRDAGSCLKGGRVLSAEGQCFAAG